MRFRQLISNTNRFQSKGLVTLSDTNSDTDTESHSIDLYEHIDTALQTIAAHFHSLLLGSVSYFESCPIERNRIGV